MLLTNTALRPGAWVKFIGNAPEFEHAHRARDGKVVGIVVGAGPDSTGSFIAADYIAVVDEVGDNLVFGYPQGYENVRVRPGEVDGLEYADRMYDAPYERVKHLFEGAAVR